MHPNLERFSGFADLYDRHRPRPPQILRDLLLAVAGTDHPDLVVDLGSGTGLSTRLWAPVARRTVGVEPNQDMRAVARSFPADGSVEYLPTRSDQTGLEAGSADIVTCSQSFHWMEPLPTLNEAARVLRAGGVFAAYDCDWPPTTGSWVAEKAYGECIDRVRQWEERSDADSRVTAWPKERHLDRIRECGRFRYAKEVAVHHVETGNADRFIGLLLTQGSVQSLLKAGRVEDEIGLTRFRETVERAMGAGPRQWYWTYRVRIGVV